MNISAARPKTVFTAEKIYTATIAASLCAILIGAMILPRFLVLGSALFGFLAFLAFRPVYGFWPDIPKKLFAFFATIILISAASTLWSVDPDTTLSRILKLTPIALGASLILAWARAVPLNMCTILAKILPIAVIIACSICAVDLLTGGFFYYAFRPDHIHAGSANLSELNRSVVIAVLSAIAILPLLMLQKKWLLFALIIAILLVIFATTQSQSAQIALITGVLTLFLFPYTHPKTVLFIAAVIIALILSSPFLAIWMYQTLPPLIEGNAWLMTNASAAGRMEIWNAVALRALESPIWGHGLEATRVVRDLSLPQKYFPLPEVMHPHNFALQIWIELGAIGAVLAASIIGIFLYRASKQTKEGLKTILPLFIAALSVAAMGFGMWQGWWLGLLVLVTCYATLSQRVIQS